MIKQMQARCTACKGMGSVIAEKDKCKGCNGEKTVKEKKTLEVFVTKGMKHGERIVFSGEADEAPDTLPGDVVVVLQQQPHDVFRREHNNLFMKKSITLLEALTGFTFYITHLDGRQLLVKSEPGVIVKPGDVKAIKDEGMPYPKNPYVRGTLFVEFDVQFPVPGSITAAHKQQLAAVLPQPAPLAAPAGESEDVTLVDVDLEQEKKKQAEQ